MENKNGILIDGRFYELVETPDSFGIEAALGLIGNNISREAGS